MIFFPSILNSLSLEICFVEEESDGSAHSRRNLLSAGVVGQPEQEVLSGLWRAVQVGRPEQVGSRVCLGNGPVFGVNNDRLSQIAALRFSTTTRAKIHQLKFFSRVVGMTQS